MFSLPLNSSKWMYGLRSESVLILSKLSVKYSVACDSLYMSWTVGQKCFVNLMRTNSSFFS